jgi:putative ABC transport system ATP-binding protein
MMSAVVSLQNVAKRYTRGQQRIDVLHRLDLEVQSGEILALMGPSGSGKTTLLNLLGGIDQADEGNVVVAGVALDTLAGAELSRWQATHVGFVFQSYNLEPGLTAEQNVELPLLLTSLSEAQRAADVLAALQLVDMSERRFHRPSELSGGEQQLIAIARALVADPTLVVCDEPTGNLDRKMADRILDLLELVNHEMGTTVVMVTHDPVAAERASRRLHLHKGRLLGAETELAA